MLSNLFVKTPGTDVTYNDLFRNDVIITRITDLSDSSLNAWSQHKDQLNHAALTTGSHLRVLYDLRDAGWLTAQDVSQVFHPMPRTSDSLHQSIALLTSPPVLGLTQMAVNGLPRPAATNIRVFLTEQDAFRWLDARLAGGG